MKRFILTLAFFCFVAGATIVQAAASLEIPEVPEKDINIFNTPLCLEPHPAIPAT